MNRAIVISTVLVVLVAGIAIAAHHEKDQLVALDRRELPEEEVGYPVCMLVSSVGHWDDGSIRRIQDLSRSYARSPAGCAS